MDIFTSFPPHIVVTEGSKKFHTYNMTLNCNASKNLGNYIKHTSWQWTLKGECWSGWVM